MTLSDPWPGFQGHGSFKRRVSPKRRILQTQLLYRTLIGNHRHAVDRQASYTAYNSLLLCKPCKLFASVARVCQRQLAFLVTRRQHSLLSVRLSVTRWYCVKTTQARKTKSSLTDSQWTLVFGVKNWSRNSTVFSVHVAVGNTQQCHANNSNKHSIRRLLCLTVIIYSRYFVGS